MRHRRTGPPPAPARARAAPSGPTCSAPPARPARSPAAAPTPPNCPTTTVEYDCWGRPAKVTETANGVTRTTTTDLRRGRPRRPRSTITGGVGAGGPGRAPSTYDPATGNGRQTTSSDGGHHHQGVRQARPADLVHRRRRWHDHAPRTTLLDRPVKVTDSAPSTVTYTYDHDAEPRGLATSDHRLRRRHLHRHLRRRRRSSTREAARRLHAERPRGHHRRRHGSRTYTRDSDGIDRLLRHREPSPSTGRSLSHVRLVRTRTTPTTRPAA